MFQQKESFNWKNLKKKTKINSANAWSITRQNTTAYDLPESEIINAMDIKQIPLIGDLKVSSQYIAGTIICLFGFVFGLVSYIHMENDRESASEAWKNAVTLQSNILLAKDAVKKVNMGDFQNIRNLDGLLDNSLSVNSKIEKHNRKLSLAKELSDSWQLHLNLKKKATENVVLQKDITKSAFTNINNMLESLIIINPSDKQNLFVYSYHLSKIEGYYAKLLAGETVNLNQLSESISLIKTFFKFPDNYVTNFKVKESYNALVNVYNASYEQNFIQLYNFSSIVNDSKPEVQALSVALDNLYILVEKNAISLDKREMSTAQAFFIAIGVFIFFLGIMVIVWIFANQERKSDLEGRLTLARNRKAVIQLLSEIDPVRDGDLTNRLTVIDEFTAPIAEAINTTIEDLGSLVLGIQTAAHDISLSTEQLRESSDKVLSLSERQVVAAEASSDSVLQMGVGLQALVQKASETANLAKSVLSNTRKGDKSISDTLESIKEVQSSVSDTKNRVIRLGKTSTQINEIAIIMREIAEKTNVLAINANLEAGRSGIVGKGFGVVAKSIQTLAKQASESAIKINGLTDSAQVDIEMAVDSVNKTASGISEVATLAKIAGSSFFEIKTTTSNLEKQVEGMKDSVISQADESSKIQKSMVTVVNIVNEVNKMNKMSAQSASIVKQSLGELNNTTDRFKVIKDE